MELAVVAMDGASPTEYPTSGIAAMPKNITPPAAQMVRIAATTKTEYLDVLSYDPYSRRTSPPLQSILPMRMESTGDLPTGRAPSDSTLGPCQSGPASSNERAVSPAPLTEGAEI